MLVQVCRFSNATILSTQVIFTQPSDCGFGVVSRQRVFQILLRRDCGRFVMDPQEAYNLLCDGLANRQLSLAELVCCVTEDDVAADRQILRKDSTADSFLTKWETINKKKYETLLDEKFSECPHSDQAFVVGQNPDVCAKFSAKGILPLFTKTDRITWLRQQARHLTANEKLVGHGWPMNKQLAELLRIPAT